MGYVRRNARVFILSPALLSLLGACGPLPERGAASATPFIPDRLLRLDAAIQKSIDDGEIPGAVALIAHQGETVYHKTFG
jgi:CubicO group peptidase (beta-lactamase class C family)